tara:strand:- start:189 stop:1061 length:873 start_codon:yes stop_codon:yes gene_type:complete
MALTLNGTTGVAGIDGSAGTPAIQGSDSNTGISFASDTLNLTTGGTTRAKINSSGHLIVNDGGGNKIGVGTDSPDYSIEVEGNGGADTVSLALTNLGSHPAALHLRSGHGNWSIINSSTIGDALEFRDESSNATRMHLDVNGSLFCVGVYNATTGSSADGVVVSSGGKLRRVTSSQRYKTSIETLEDKYADAILEARPVWYKSLCADDNKDYGHWGFIAEEIEKIDPRLCSYKDTELVVENYVATEKKLDTPIVESVQYERFVPHLVNLVKRQDTRIKALETKVAALEAA